MGKLLNEQRKAEIENFRSKNTEMDQNRLVLGSLLKSDATALVEDSRVEMAIQALVSEILERTPVKSTGKFRN